MKTANYKHYLNRLLKLAIPIIISNIISQVQMVVDRAFLGQKNPLYMSALGNVNSPIWMTISFCFSLSVGASILISQGIGAGNEENTEKYASAMMKWNNVIPILLFIFWLLCPQYLFRLMGVSENVMPFCLTYTRYYAPIFLVVGLEASSTVIMQTSNYTKPLVFYGAVRAGLNVILDWLLIFGNLGFPEWGIKGAAVATMISEYAGCIYAFYIFVTSKKLITRPSLKAIVSARLRTFVESAKLGLNAALEDFAWNLGNLMLITILNTIDEMAAGIYSMIFSIEVLVVVVVGAIGNGTLTLTGEAKGRKDVKEFKGICVVAYGISVILAVIMLIVCLLFPRSIIGLFTKDTAIITICSSYLIFMCLNLYAKSANMIIGSGIRGSGDTKWMFMSQIFGTFFVVGCASLFVFVLKLGIIGVFLAVIVDEIVRAFINLLHFLRLAKDI